MNQYKEFVPEQQDIITVISSSERTVVSLVRISEQDELAVLKEYRQIGIKSFYEHIRQLQSAYFPMIYRVWEAQECTYVLEEYIAGKTLQDYLDEETLLKQEQLQWYMQELCKALMVLHHAVPPIIHRDIKPGNIMISDSGKLKLLDFDAAREYKEECERDTVLLGTREYASPEQFGFMQTDVRSDIYSVGVMFAELLEHASVTKRYGKRAGKIIDRATMFDPENRYKSVTGLLKELQVLDKTRHKWLIPGVVGMLLTGACIVVMLSVGRQEKNAPEEIISVQEKNDSQVQREPREEVQEELQEELPEMDDVTELGEGNGSAKRVNLPYPVPLELAYIYRSMEDEVHKKCYRLMDERPDLFEGCGDPSAGDGRYSIGQECVIGSDYITLRFLQAYPRDITIRDERMEGFTLESIYGYPYDEDAGTNGEKFVLEKENYKQRFGNVVTISKEYLQTLEPGAYTFFVEVADGASSSLFPFYLVVNGVAEQVEDPRLFMFNEIAYYSSKSRNDVFFYINNTPSPIQSLEVDGRQLDISDYQLVEDGYGVVIYPEFLEQYEDSEFIRLTITTENGRYIYCRVIFLQKFYE